ncbi:MAG: ribosomal L7Ae/L30e/S12e/Gadd45 family protein [Acutalibacteraceae bacterium]|nr:ribosomal L7Ae/L30e/S12e/Gadd45 family protein [Acutalibacteraceae bacterium]
MKTDSILSLLGFAAKAGKLSFGTHATEFAITSKKASLVLAAEDISEKTVKELKFKADKNSIPVITLKGINTAVLSSRVGKNCGIVAVNDKGFADALIKQTEGGKTL